MDPPYAGPKANAPGGTVPGDGGGGSPIPPATEWRRPVDERLAPPETRVEYMNGIELFAAPADAPHATQHFDLGALLAAHIAPGYRGAVDMLTRTSEDSDFAPDASIFKDDILPDGSRPLEDLVFEVASEQSLGVPTGKARALIARGVRRAFCILVKQGRVLEWSRETDGWSPLPHDARIEDPCFVRPLEVRAVLNVSARDDAMVRALIAKETPAVSELIASSEAIGEARALRETIFDLAMTRGLALTDEDRARVEGEREAHRLRALVRSLAVAPSFSEAWARAERQADRPGPLAPIGAKQ